MEDPATAKELPPKLDTIPIEVVCLIIETLTLDIHTPYPEGGSPDCCAEKDEMARKALRSMCLVSKRIGSVASRYLYQHICLRHPSTVVLLFCSLVRNPELETRIKRISYDIPFYLHQSADLEPLRSIEGQGWTEFLDEVLAREEAYGYRMNNAHLIESLHFRILGRISSLQWLEFSLPAPLLGSIFPAPRLPASSPPSPGVQQLERPWMYRRLPHASGPQRLHLIGRRAFPSTIEDEPKHTFKEYLDQCKVQSLMWSMDYIAWFSFLQDGDEWKCETVTEMELRESTCLPIDLIRLCAAFPRLESLSVDSRTSEEHIKLFEEDDTGLKIDKKFVSDALAGLTNLHTLSLDLYYGQDINTTLGPSGVLDLTALSNLHTLEAPIRFFVQKQYGGGVDHGEEGDTEEGDSGLANAEIVLRPAAVLPKSLQRLTLLTDVRCLEDFEEEEAIEAIYQQKVIMLEFLDALCSTCNEDFPLLRRVCYRQGVEGADECACIRDPTPPVLPFPFYPQAGDLDGSLVRLAEISKSFRRNAVEFKGVARTNPCLRLEPHVAV